jgi:polysaccharide deacetylase 2 family uncharacterized protein YibQ
MDDVGENLNLLKQLDSISFPVTVSVLPDAPYCKESAEWAHRQGLEVMVHLPMQPQNYPEDDPGKEALLASMNRIQLKDRTAELLAAVPHAVGTNNHMGSRLTEMQPKMSAVLDAVAKRGFFFIDSRTSPDSVAFRMATAKGVPSARRSLFLDNVVEGPAIRRQINELVEIARKEGSAVGICHLKEQTVAVLKQLNAADYPGVQFTFASEAVTLTP